MGQLNNFQLVKVAQYLGINIDNSKAHDSIYNIVITLEMKNELNPKEKITCKNTESVKISKNQLI